MYPPKEKKYFTAPDYSYVLTTNTAIATKVWFGYANHSAVTTSSTDYLISKFGSGPRFKHKIAHCPYYPNVDITYYVKPAISGQNTVV